MYPEPGHFSIVTPLVKAATGAHLEHSSMLLLLPLSQYAAASAPVQYAAASAPVY